MVARSRRPKPVRGALVAAAALVLAHLFLRDAVEGARLLVLARFAAPAAFVRGWTEGERSAPDAARVVEARASARAGLFASRGAAALPVLDHRPDEGFIVVGAGRESNVAYGAAVTSPEGLIGHVDRVETHLARVKLISASGARAAVVLDGVRTGLPGGIERLAAVVEGRGVHGALVDGALLEAFRPGDRLVAYDSPETPVGVVSRAGLEPGVVFAAQADSAGAVAVAGVTLSIAPPSLFQTERLRVVAEPACGGFGALVMGAEARRLSPGAAIHRGGVYLGRVVRVAVDVAYATRIADRGHRVGVRGTFGGKEAGLSLVSLGDGLFQADPAPAFVPPGEAFDAFTAGGGGLVPPDLYVGRLRRADGGLWRSDDVVARWPREVDGAVFVFEEERARLRSGK